ncbi:MAG TPA: SUMF1/EgtB/PvdO family nonheme iron enzyme, partial [Gemmatimonadaceae bacterium]|nr:SUMF1/EgtB/PvdO family nonheme iron enzyme [Gemmatimonadaceae bacterium]
WLTRNLSGVIEFSEMPGIYNPFEHPRAERAALPLPTLQQMLQRLAEIRSRVLDQLDSLQWDGNNPLLREGFVYHMVLQHEYQHNETILQTLQLKQGAPYAAPRSVSLPPVQPIAPGMIHFPGGEITIGTDDTRVAYDNERPLYAVRLHPFLIDRTPVTNGRYLEFIDDDGYSRSGLWSERGRQWLAESKAVAPKYWRRDGANWTERVMDLVRPVDPARPVCHVCYYEAEAFAGWDGKRLPTEIEWEAAASWDPAVGNARVFPWGDEIESRRDANVDQLAFDTAPVGSFPRNFSPVGCYGLIGDVWEWTSSDFSGYPGFRSFPYREYSEEFFGTAYKVLRGGSWATRPGAIRNTFRNWDYPIRRQIFSGFRCARDA